MFSHVMGDIHEAYYLAEGITNRRDCDVFVNYLAVLSLTRNPSFPRATPLYGIYEISVVGAVMPLTLQKPGFLSNDFLSAIT